MKEYSELSDFELNKAVAEALGLEFTVQRHGAKEDEKGSVWVNTDYGFGTTRFNVVNHNAGWAQLMVDNRIDLFWIETGKKWRAERFSDLNIDVFDWVSEKPGRAVAICFLMMRDAENER